MGDKQYTSYMNGRAKLLQANLFITEKKMFSLSQQQEILPSFPGVYWKEIQREKQYLCFHNKHEVPDSYFQGW